MQYYNDKTLLFLNGKYTKAAEATTDLYGQSLHYGYGAFEGIRAYNTHNGARIFKADEHFARLKQSCELINIPYSWNNEQLIDSTYTLLELNGFRDAYIRPLIFCSPNMALTQPLEISIVISAWEWDVYLGNHLLRLCISSIQRPNPNSIKIEAKATGYYANGIIATIEAKNQGFDEALLLDMNGNIAETPGANFFLEKNGSLYTPPKGNIMPGITRATVFEISKSHGIEVIEKHLSMDDIKTADSAFICGTAVEISGVKSIDDTIFKTDWQDSLGSIIQRTYKNLVLEKENYEVII